MNLFKRLPKKLLVAVAGLITAVGITSVTLAGFGPDRPTFTLANPADHVTFNSIIDNTTVMGGNGDERAFSTGAIDGDSTWSDPVVNASNGEEITIRAYVHNNAKADLNLVAENVMFKVDLPTEMDQVHQVTSTISSSNAAPTSVFDTLDISAENGFYSQLEYVPGSARFSNNVFTGNGVALSDSIVTSGATLGYDALNGRIPGCLNFSGWVTLKVRVKVPSYQVAKTARLSGEGADKWRESVNAAPGDKIDYRIEFVNNGPNNLKDIRIYDKLPTHMKVVPGSVKLIDGANPASNPYVYPESAVTENGTRIDLVISGPYAPKTDPNLGVYIRFQAEFVDNQSIRCGTTLFTNVAYLHPTQVEGVVNDGAHVYLVNPNQCVEPETPVYACKDVAIEKLGGRKVKVSITANGTPAARVSIVGYEYNFGDGSTPLTSTATTAEHTYAADGTYKVSAKVTFRVDGANQTVTSATCEESVTFSPTTTTTTPPKTLPNTGAGSTIGMFMITSLVGMFIYRAYAARKM